MGAGGSDTILVAHQKNVDNPSYQYLVNKYVDSSLFKAEEVRNHFLSIAPPSLYVKQSKSEFLGIGNQWLWERDDNRCWRNSGIPWGGLVFMANLLQREFKLELAAYEKELPLLIQNRQVALDGAVTELRTEYGKFNLVEKRVSDFIEICATAITAPETTYPELLSLQSLMVSEANQVAGLDMQALASRLRSARLAYAELLNLYRISAQVSGCRTHR